MHARHFPRRQQGSVFVLLMAALIIGIAMVLLWPNILNNENKASTTQPESAVRQAQAMADQAADAAQQQTRNAVAAAENAAAGQSADGQNTAVRPDVRDVLTRCLTCHAPNSALPHVPRVGNRDDWAPLLQKGKKTLTDNAYYGYVNPNGGVMPPKGGDAGLTYAEVEAAVVYLANQSGGHFE